ncbi:MAG: DJ-1/PfpI family protein [Candidatus Micrarchaeota archaeon]|nr:DJ-1/PfpI family protein [Candidatus Micrarchaeota archaeon]
MIDLARALFVVAKNGFRDEELFHPREELEKAGVKTAVASSAKGPCSGKLGGSVEAETSLGEVDPAGFDAIVFVGGPGAAQFFNDRNALSLAKRFRDAGKVVAAICIAPGILANAGILRGVRATCFPDTEGKENLKDRGAKCSDEPVVVDGKIITANGPGAAREFGKKIAQALG